MTGGDIHVALHRLEGMATELACEVVSTAAEIRCRLMIMQELVDAGDEQAADRGR